MLRGVLELGVVSFYGDRVNGTGALVEPLCGVRVVQGHTVDVIVEGIAGDGNAFGLAGGELYLYEVIACPVIGMIEVEGAGNPGGIGIPDADAAGRDGRHGGILRVVAILHAVFWRGWEGHREGAELSVLKVAIVYEPYDTCRGSYGSAVRGCERRTHGYLLS